MKPYSRHQIEALLDKFMAGKTTIEEESLLSQYFSTAHDVPAEWEDYQALFGYIDRGLGQPNGKTIRLCSATSTVGWKETCFLKHTHHHIASGFGGFPQRQSWHSFSALKF